MADTVHKGACACGKVRFEARGAPYRVGVCHCLTCRRVHGAPFNFYVVFPADAVAITGAVTAFESSGHGRRYACASCNAPVYSHYDHPDEVDLYPASFDEPGLFQPTYELWVSRREPWLPEFPSVIHRYETSRPWRRRED
jgi:hypothetical protein